MNLDPRQLVGYYNRLAPRERVLVGVATLATLVISLYTFIWDPLQSNQALLARRIATKEKDLAAIERLRETYLDLERYLEANQAATSLQNPNFNLFASVQKTVSEAVSRENITSMNPSTKPIGTDFQEEQVEIKLQKVSLPQLVDFLYRVEKGAQPLRFSRLQIKKRPNPDIYNFDVTATISLLKTIDKGAEKPGEKPAEKPPGRTLGS